MGGALPADRSVSHYHSGVPTLPDASRSADRTLDERYALGASVGHGSSAAVYLAEDLRLGRQVAVKMALPALANDRRFLRRFRAEARAAAQLNHPHLLAVFDWGDGDEAYLVTEYLAGGSLRSILESGHRLSLSQALMVGLHAAEGLDHAHRQGFVHRDIKPANVLFGADGRLRIADFGIARAVAEAAWTEPEGALIGTARYAAPEQAKGEAVDARSDVYSLALTLIEAVTGQVPLVESTPLATMVRRQDTDVPVPPELGPLAEVLADAGRVDPSQRPDARTFAQRLSAAASSLPRPEPLPIAQAVGDTARSAVPDDRPEAVLSLDDNPTIDLSNGERSDGEGIMLDDATRGDDPTGPGFFDADLDPDLAPEPVGGRGVLFVVVGLVALIGLVIAAIAFVPRSEIVGPTTTAAPPAVVLDDLVGDQIESVRSIATANGWTLIEREVRADGSAVGEVLAQQPPAGTELNDGATIRVDVSSGAELRVVPDVVGDLRADAITAINEAGLVLGTVDSEVFDEDVPAGSVVSSSLAAGDEVETGSVVDLEVSAGPEPRIVPALAGLTPAEAEPVLAELGLVMAIAEEHSMTVAEGLIIDSAPTLDESIARDGTVTVTVSLGLPFITVPDVTGETAVDADTILTEAGFTVTGTQGSPNGEVLVTNPPAGETYRFGHEILIITR